MKLLLDTHSFLWFIMGSPKMVRVRALIEDDGNDKLLSLASLWEMAIKQSLFKQIVFRLNRVVLRLYGLWSYWSSICSHGCGYLGH